MKKVLVVLAGGLLFAATAVLADPPQYGGQGNQQSQADHGDRGGHGKQDKRDKRDKHDRRGDSDRSYADRDDRGNYNDRDYRQDKHGRYDRHGNYYVMHDRGRHEGWYKKGGYVPVEYRSSRYVVDDWQVYHLRQPPRGYHWVRSDNSDYLLIAIASGVIADIFLSN